ncbi:LysM peptidoglycan-binding domain-containing protein [Lactiplantibacillus fabifermentans]|uniref:Transglycosylase n=2 Tax=Lactiplantibacillus fabifermentans TaxID=483011 RepID=W6TB77_9LACO|nr:LysM peptidoglycan-binding domain-containing protein [Lactiplantibacillus fabifermentans]ETY75518.1 transglycosylase [Lactiplantibacillus fabifermentans T30PCM01]
MKAKNVVLSTMAALGLFAVTNTVANADTVTVKSGDTVAKIAAANNTTVSAIEKANNMKNVNLIYVGDKLEVGTSTSSTTASAATTATKAATSTTTTASSAASSSAATTTSASSASSTTATTASSTSTSSTTSSYTGSNLKSYVLSQMQSRTGVSASTWNTIITRESNWEPYVKNSSSGAYGLFQNMHISSGSVEAQVDAAVALYEAQGMAAWAL